MRQNLQFTRKSVKQTLIPQNRGGGGFICFLPDKKSIYRIFYSYVEAAEVLNPLKYRDSSAKGRNINFIVKYIKREKLVVNELGYFYFVKTLVRGVQVRHAGPQDKLTQNLQFMFLILIQMNIFMFIAFYVVHYTFAQNILVFIQCLIG